MFSRGSFMFREPGFDEPAMAPLATYARTGMRAAIHQHNNTPAPSLHIADKQKWCHAVHEKKAMDYFPRLVWL
jgi:hypothetical protein